MPPSLLSRIGSKVKPGGQPSDQRNTEHESNKPLPGQAGPVGASSGAVVAAAAASSSSSPPPLAETAIVAASSPPLPVPLPPHQRDGGNVSGADQTSSQTQPMFPNPDDYEVRTTAPSPRRAIKAAGTIERVDIQPPEPLIPESLKTFYEESGGGLSETDLRSQQARNGNGLPDDGDLPGLVSTVNGPGPHVPQVMGSDTTTRSGAGSGPSSRDASSRKAIGLQERVEVPMRSTSRPVEGPVDQLPKRPVYPGEKYYCFDRNNGLMLVTATVEGILESRHTSTHEIVESWDKGQELLVWDDQKVRHRVVAGDESKRSSAKTGPFPQSTMQDSSGTRRPNMLEDSSWEGGWDSTRQTSSHNGRQNSGLGNTFTSGRNSAQPPPISKDGDRGAGPSSSSREHFSGGNPMMGLPSVHRPSVQLEPMRNQSTASNYVVKMAGERQCHIFTTDGLTLVIYDSENEHLQIKATLIQGLELTQAGQGKSSKGTLSKATQKQLDDLRKDKEAALRQLSQSQRQIDYQAGRFKEWLRDKQTFPNVVMRDPLDAMIKLADKYYSNSQKADEIKAENKQLRKVQDENAVLRQDMGKKDIEIANHDQEIQAIKRKDADDREKSERQWAFEFKQQSENHGEEMARARQDWQTKLAGARQQHVEEMAEQKSRYELKIAELESTLSARDNEYNRRDQERSLTHEEEMNRLQADLLDNTDDFRPATDDTLKKRYLELRLLIENVTEPMNLNVSDQTRLTHRDPTRFLEKQGRQQMKFLLRSLVWGMIMDGFFSSPFGFGAFGKDKGLRMLGTVLQAWLRLFNAGTLQGHDPFLIFEEQSEANKWRAATFQSVMNATKNRSSGVGMGKFTGGLTELYLENQAKVQSEIIGLLVEVSSPGRGAQRALKSEVQALVPDIVRTAAELALEFGAQRARLDLDQPPHGDVVTIGREFIDCVDGDLRKGSEAVVDLMVSPSLYRVGNGKGDLETTRTIAPGEVYPKR